MLRCPKCGFTGKMYITATANIEVDGDSELTEDHDGFDCNEQSICACSNCYYEGRVKEFKLDYQLKMLKRDK